jgi:hypothetical protein
MIAAALGALLSLSILTQFSHFESRRLNNVFLGRQEAVFLAQEENSRRVSYNFCFGLNVTDASYNCDIVKFRGRSGCSIGDYGNLSPHGVIRKDSISQRVCLYRLGRFLSHHGLKSAIANAVQISAHIILVENEFGPNIIDNQIIQRSVSRPSLVRTALIFDVRQEKDGSPQSDGMPNVFERVSDIEPWPSPIKSDSRRKIERFQLDPRSLIGLHRVKLPLDGIQGTPRYERAYSSNESEHYGEPRNYFGRSSHRPFVVSVFSLILTGISILSVGEAYVFFVFRDEFFKSRMKVLYLAIIALGSGLYGFILFAHALFGAP